jgi:hypothetical protein
MEQYNASLPYDRLFYAQDIAGSIAFARANYNNKILTEDEFKAIEKGLLDVKEEWKAGKFEVKQNDEDIHTANERRLSELVGKDIGGKLHTGRSRNEQIATDMRLWLREELRTIEGYLAQLVKTAVQRAGAEIDVLVRFSLFLIRMQARRSRTGLSTGKLTTNRCQAILTSKRRNQSAGPTGSSPTPPLSPPNSSVSAKS